MNILVTGGAGYIGGMLVKRLLEDGKVESVTVVDLKPRPVRIPENPRLSWIEADLAEAGWETRLPKVPEKVVHCAFKIRNPFGKISAIRKNNLEACRRVFSYCFENAVDKLVYLSSVAAYGARKENIGRLITEDEPLADMTSPYGSQKREVEELLSKLRSEFSSVVDISILRLNSVTGPVGQSLSSKFGLVTILTKLFPFVIELHSSWGRQFVHENDVIGAIEHLLGEKSPSSFEIFNIAPKRFLSVADIARTLGKRTVRVPVLLMRFTLAVLWPASFGRLVPPSAVSGLMYPINVSNEKAERAGIVFKHGPEDALLGRT